MVFEHEGDHASQWAAIGSIAAKIGCTAETLRGRQAERDQGKRAGPTSDDRVRINALEREVSELSQTNEMVQSNCARELPRNSAWRLSGTSFRLNCCNRRSWRPSARSRGART